MSPRPVRRRSTLSPKGWRLICAYEDELQKTSQRAMAHELRGLAAFMRWLVAYDVDLPCVLADDLHAYRLSLNVSASAGASAGADAGADDATGAFDVVRRFYRFLYCRGLLRHDPGALFAAPTRTGARAPRRKP
jgi:hypothetical protein